MKNPIKIGLLPITKQIVVGRVNEKTGMWAGERTDVTNDAIVTVGDYLLETKQSMCFPKNGKTYAISVEEIEL